ncbi:hypothetical protein ACFY9Q_22035 [Streptomyces sp. NPDC012389]|uniref:hypothetical protein n=1 Tax=Streptomyces sp. NPDC012389 TaxID=3364830 RepID=UPI0036EC323F
MVITLPEAAKLGTTDLQCGVIEDFVQESSILDRLPLLAIEGNSYAYNEEGALSGVEFLPRGPSMFVRVCQLGGAQQTPVSGRPRLDVHCWAESESAAHDLAALSRALLGDIPGVRGGATVYRVAEVGAHVAAR